MKFIVTIATVMVEATNHHDAAVAALKRLDHQGEVDICVCDLEIGVREYFITPIEAYPEQVKPKS